MIEDFSDFMSLTSLVFVILMIVFFVIKSYLRVRERQLIKEEIEYYRER